MSHTDRTVSSQATESTATPLKSTLSCDPDMAELVQFFVEEMSDRVSVIHAAVQANDLAQLRIVAHQLKGAATGYGFAPISSCAATLEQQIDAADPCASIDELRGEVDELVDLCRRVAV